MLSCLLFVIVILTAEVNQLFLSFESFTILIAEVFLQVVCPLLGVVKLLVKTLIVSDHLISVLLKTLSL
jgi:hypothetical protein